MKLNITRHIIPLLALIFTACQKVDVPDPVDVGPSQPVFYTDLDLGQGTFSVAAGQDNYVMDADFSVEATGYLDLTGYLRPVDCPDRTCRNSLKISLRHREIYQGHDFKVDDILKKENYEYAWTWQRDSVIVTFQPQQAPDNTTVISWKIDDEREIRNRHQIERILKVDQNYAVLLKVSQQSCESSQLQTVNLTKGGCQSRIRVENRRAVVRSTGVPPFKYQWSTGSRDSVIMIDASVVNTAKKISVKVIDRRNCLSESTLGFSPGTANDHYCETAFSYSTNPLSPASQHHLGRVFIEYRDDQGNLFRSNGYRQPRESSFEILEVSDFEENERGQKTKKIRARISCLLGSRDKPEEEIKLSGLCVFAVAYPD